MTRRQRCPSRLLLVVNFTILLLSLPCSNNIAYSFSTGAGGCEGNGVAAVGGLHLTSENGRVVDTATLDVAGVVVSIGSTTLESGSGSTVQEFPVGQELVVTVTSQQIQFLGFLIRLQLPTGANSTVATLEQFPNDNESQRAEACIEPIQGITHRSNSQKFSASALLQVDELLSGVILDVTIVYTNGQPASIYAYSEFTIDFAQSAATPSTSSPVTGSETPSAIPDSTFPSVVPTLSPTFSTTSSTSKSPNDSPSIVTTGIPSSLPSGNPTEMPSNIQEFVVPTAEPTLVDSGPTMSPSLTRSTRRPNKTSPTGNVPNRPRSSPMKRPPHSRPSKSSSKDGVDDEDDDDTKKAKDGSKMEMGKGKQGRHKKGKSMDSGTDKMSQVKKQKKKKKKKDKEDDEQNRSKISKRMKTK